MSVENGSIVIAHEETEQRSYEIPVTARLRVSEGVEIEAGDMITEGSKNPHEILAIQGVDAVREYLVSEIQKVYRSHGVTINDKHIEVIVRQMQRRVRASTRAIANSRQPVDRFERADKPVHHRKGVSQSRLVSLAGHHQSRIEY